MLAAASEQRPVPAPISRTCGPLSAPPRGLSAAARLPGHNTPPHIAERGLSVSHPSSLVGSGEPRDDTARRRRRSSARGNHPRPSSLQLWLFRGRLRPVRRRLQRQRRAARELGGRSGEASQSETLGWRQKERLVVVSWVELRYARGSSQDERERAVLVVRKLAHVVVSHVTQRLVVAALSVDVTPARSLFGVHVDHIFARVVVAEEGGASLTGGSGSAPPRGTSWTNSRR